MLDNLANYPKSEIMRRMLRPAIGDSLFNADGAEWKWQRQAVAPVFTHRNVVALAPAMTATAERAVQAAGRRTAAPRLVSEMLTATFDVICDVALSGREHFDSAHLQRGHHPLFPDRGPRLAAGFSGLAGMVSPARRTAGGGVGPHHAWHGGRGDRGAAQGDAPAPADDLLDHMLAARGSRRPASA